MATYQLLARGQGNPPQTEDYLGVAQEFLREMYPTLTGENYVLTIEASQSYDKQGQQLRSFSLDVGEAPKFDDPAHLGYPRGCAGAPVPQPIPSPPELGPQSQPKLPEIPFPYPSPSQSFKHKINCGPNSRPMQFLSTSFGFDDAGRLARFTATGPAIGDRDADARFAAYVYAHSEMTYADVVIARKKSGAKYSFDDKDQFLKDAPWLKLEKFFG